MVAATLLQDRAWGRAAAVEAEGGEAAEDFRPAFRFSGQRGEKEDVGTVEERGVLRAEVEHRPVRGCACICVTVYYICMP